MNQKTLSTTLSLNLSAALLVMVPYTASHATDDNTRNVGIQFTEMPVGTQWVVRRVDRKTRYIYTYIGQQDNEHRLRIEALKPGKKPKQIAIRYFDPQGRLLRSESHLGESRRYEPFDCTFRTGPCTHTYYYPLPPKKGKTRTRSTKTRFDNRRRDNGIEVVRFSRSGDRRTYWFELGKYNIRVSNKYTNALGKKRGFDVISIKAP
jgi:hypothetical protein